MHDTCQKSQKSRQKTSFFILSLHLSVCLSLSARYGKSIYETTDKALVEHDTLKGIDDSEKRAVTAPDPRETGRLLFKPEGYLFQKRMAGVDAE